MIFQRGTASAPEIYPGTRIQGTITAGSIQTYLLHLEAGTTAELVLEQGGTDLSVTVFPPQGDSIYVDARENGPEPVMIDPQTTGTYKLEIQTVEKRPQTVTYQLVFRELRPRKADDALLLEAQAEVSSSKKLLSPGSPTNLRKGLEQAEKALGIWHQSGRHEDEAATLVEIGAFHFLLNEFDQARTNNLEALRIAHELSASWVEGEALNDLGLALWQLSEFKEATRNLSLALGIWRKLGHHYGEAAALNNLAILHRETGDYEQARDYYRKALPIVISLQDKTHEPYIWSNLGVVFRALAQDKEALDCFHRSVVLFHAAGNRSGEGRALLHVARIYLSEKSPDTALKYVRQALPLTQAAEDYRSLGDGWQILGEISSASHEKAEAMTHYQKALEAYRKVSNRVGEASTLHSMGVMYGRSGEARPAMEFLNQAREIRHSLGIRDGEAETLYWLATEERADGHLPEALAHIEAALDLTDAIRGLIAGPQARMSYLASKEAYFSSAADLCLQLDQQYPGQGFSATAFEIIEHGRARSLLDLLGETRRGIGQRIVPKLRSRAERLREQINFWSARLTEASTQNNSARQQQAAQQVETFLQQYHELESEIRAADPRYQLLAPRPLSVAEVQKQLLDKDTVLLEYALGENQSHVWVITTASLAVYSLPDTGKIESAIRRFYRQLHTSSTASRNASAILGRMLLRPAVAELHGKRLLIVGDAMLQRVPFAALSDPESGAPLVRDHEIVLVPSASVLEAQREIEAGRKPPSKKLAVIGDPVFDSGDSRTGIPAVRAIPLFPRLPYTRLEAEQILTLAPREKSLGALDFSADRELFLSAKLANYEIIHIATHAVVDPFRPELSALVFSLVDSEGRPRNGYLRLHEIASLRLSARLVTLSGCGTGRGQEIPGEGVIGLARGFLHAGAVTVVVSLWNVEDESTAELMKLFYEQMLGPRHLRPAAALRQAQIAIAREKRWTPYHWAGWMVIGDWR